MSLSYSYSELLSCSWMLKQKRIFYSHTHAWMCPLNHTIITLTCRQAHHSSCPLSLQPLSAQHFLCPTLSPLHPALSPPSPLSLLRNFSPLLSLSPLWVGDCGSWSSDLQVVGGGYIFYWDILFYCIIYDLRCLVYCKVIY